MGTDVFRFLEQKPLYYDEIDYNRFPTIYDEIKHHFTKNQTIIHLIGTNGKGSTGRFIAQVLYKHNISVGHYSSPHIRAFNERIWINGKDTPDQTLENAHKKLQSILSKEHSKALSYFEYTTLLAMLCFASCEVILLEAGLGGEYDATAVFEHTYTVITPIDFDHQAFLGETLREIATTKLNIMAKEAVIAKQKHQEVEHIAKKIAQKKNANLVFVTKDNNAQRLAQEVATEQNMPLYLQENLATAIVMLQKLNISPKKEDFYHKGLFGRCTQIAPNIIVDVGHNPLAAQALYDTLKPDKYILIYNTYGDKEYEKILTILQPIILHVEIIPVFSQRVEEREKLQNILKQLKIQYCSFKQIQNNKRYLVFGSFMVVEEFLKQIDE